MRLDQLPPDLLTSIPEYLFSLDDLYSLIKTSRVFYECCASTKARLRPSFARRYGQPLFPPHPHLLIAGSARSVADWAVQDKANELRLMLDLSEEDVQSNLDAISQLSLSALSAASSPLLRPGSPALRGRSPSPHPAVRI